jgi:hypothetical protein
MNEWICVKERLPNKLQKVLFHWICPGGNKNVSMGYLCNEGWDIYLPYHSFKMCPEKLKVTHWMELPEFPKQEEKLEMDERTKAVAKRFIDDNADLLKRLADR